MKLEEYENIKKALKNEKLLKYDILSYIEKHIITDNYTFKAMFQELEEISEQDEIIKLYTYIKKLNYENSPYLYTQDYKQLLFEFKKHVINSTRTMRIIDTY